MPANQNSNITGYLPFLRDFAQLDPEPFSPRTLFRSPPFLPSIELEELSLVFIKSWLL